MIAGDVPPRLDRKRKNGHSSIEMSPQARLRENLPEGVVVPGAVLDLVARALELKPSARFRNATEFREALELLPTYTPTYIEPRRIVRRSPLASVGVWIIGVLLLVLAFVVLTPVGQEMFARMRAAAFAPDEGPRGEADANPERVRLGREVGSVPTG